jgi:HEAT repeat protein
VRSALGAFVVVNAVLTAALLTMVVGRKLRRDRRERRHHRARAELRGALLHGQRRLDHHLRRAARSGRSHTDLVAVLHTVVDEDVLDRVRAAATRTGVVASLVDRLPSKDPATRGGAAMLLGLLRAEGATEHLAPLLADPDGDVRLVAAGALGRLANHESARALVDALAGHVLTEERLVERLDGPWAVPAILHRMARSGPGEGALRASLARALGLTGDARGEGVLAVLLRGGTVEERVCAARALGTVGLAPGRQALIAAMDDPAWEVRAQAARALGQIQAVAAVPVLERNLGHRAWWVRANAADALTRLGPPGHAALARVAAGDDPYAAERATEALALVGQATPAAAA